MIRGQLATAEDQELRARYEKLAAQAIPPRSKPKTPGFQSPEVWGENE